MTRIELIKEWPMSRRVYLFLFAAILIAIFSYFFTRVILGPLVSVEVLHARPFSQTIVASGRVESPHRVDVGVQITGRVQTVKVREGDLVVPGTILFELESDELQAAHQQAEFAKKQAYVKLKQFSSLQEPVAEQAFLQTKANLDSAQRNLERTIVLAQKGFLGAAAKEDAERAQVVAHAQFKVAQQQLFSLRQGGSDVVAAELALAYSRSTAEAARARLNYTNIKSPVSGTLISRSLEPGDMVQPGRVLMTISPQGEMQLVLQIDEKNLHLLQLNQPALASADAYPHEYFEARIVFIHPGIDPQRGSVEIKLSVPKPPSYLKQDMTVSVDIEVARREKALLLAMSAIHDSDRAQPWVTLIEDGKTKRQLVTLGIISNGIAEVISGIKEGDAVVIDPEARFKQGARARPQVSVKAP
jgi:HlyD family secretion protein